MDEFGDQVSHQLSAGLCADPADRGRVDIDDAAALMHADGVGAVVHQPPVPLLDNICVHLPPIGRWVHHAAFDLAVAGVVVARVQTRSSWMLSSPLCNQRSDRFLNMRDPVLAMGCVKGGEAIA
jgi:hypothetical protein